MSKLSARFQKLLLLISLFFRRPSEFCDRIRHIGEVKIERISRRNFTYSNIQSYDDVIYEISKSIGVPHISILEEREFLEIEKEIIRGKIALINEAPFRITHSPDFALAWLSYYLCRAIAPEVVIETGVGFGVTSAYILSALSVNQKGTLYSIDLPPLGVNADNYIGWLIPGELHDRWRLYRGSSRRTLLTVLNEVGNVDIFLHDSLHTFSNMTWEFQTVTPYLRSEGIVVSDDITDNNAFQVWVDQVKPEMYKVIRKIDSESCIGFAKLPSIK